MSISKMSATPHIMALDTNSTCSSSNISSPSCYEQSCCKSAAESISRGQKQDLPEVHARTAFPAQYMRVQRQNNKHPLYTSKLLGQQRQISIKLRSDMDIASLPSDLATQLQASLTDICGCSYSISKLAVREGCIMLRGDLMPTKAAATASSGPAQDLQSELLSLARAMLPCLEPILGEGKGQHRSTGEQVRLQHGDNIICCYWDATQQAWQLVHQKAWEHEQQVNMQLGLIRAATSTYLQRHRANFNQQATASIMQGSSMQARDIGPQSAAVTTTAANSQQVELLVEIQIQMSDQDVTGRSHVITGWVPPRKHSGNGPPWREDLPAPGRAFMTSGGVIQVLAHANGQYYETKVLQTSRQLDKPATIMLSIHLPDPKSFHSLHHAGQKPPCLQLLTLELWCEELLLDTSTALLPPLNTSTTNNRSGRQQPCWWWGSRPATVTAAAHEVAACAHKLWLNGTSDVSHSHNRFLHDLALFLTGVRITLQSFGICTTIAAASSDAFSTNLTDPALDRKELQQLGNNLADYARLAGLQKLLCMLRDQQHALSRCVRTLTCNITSHGDRTSGGFSRDMQLVFQLLSRLWISIFGYSCWQCERAYRKRLSHHLASVQAVYAAVGFATISMTMRDLAVKWSVADACRYFGWGIPVCIVSAQQFIQRVRPQPNTRHSTCSHMSALCLLIIAVDWITAATGLVQPSTTLLKMYRSFLGPVLMLLLSLGEQLGASVVLPAPIVTLLAITIATCLTAAGAYVGPCWAGAILNVLVTVVARLLADMHLRGMLMSPSRASTRMG